MIGFNAVFFLNALVYKLPGGQNMGKNQGSNPIGKGKGNVCPMFVEFPWDK